MRALVAGLAATAGCIEGPFERANPNDAQADLTMTIVGGLDTVRTPASTVFFQLVTDPPMTGYTTIWTSSNPGYLATVGDGRFWVPVLPTSPEQVFVTARIGGNATSRLVVVMPPAP